MPNRIRKEPNKPSPVNAIYEQEDIITMANWNLPAKGGHMEAQDGVY